MGEEGRAQPVFTGLEDGGGATSQGMQTPLEAGRGKETDDLLEPPGRTVLLTL